MFRFMYICLIYIHGFEPTLYHDDGITRDDVYMAVSLRVVMMDSSQRGPGIGSFGIFLVHLSLNINTKCMEMLSINKSVQQRLLLPGQYV